MKTEKNKKNYNVGDKVYSLYNQHYDKAHIVECIIEEIHGDELYVYSVYDNRAFYCHINEVMTYNELMDDIDIIRKDNEDKIKQ